MLPINLLVIIVLAFACATGAAQQTMSPPPTPVIPSSGLTFLEVTSMKEAGEVPGVPAEVARRFARYDVTISNRSGESVMLYTINYQFLDGNGAPVGKVCGTKASLNPHKPVLAATQTIKNTENLSRKGAIVTPLVDLVLLADGSYQGNDECRSLDKYQTQLQMRRATQRAILADLETKGLERTIEKLRDELSNVASSDEKYLRPKKVSTRAAN